VRAPNRTPSRRQPQPPLEPASLGRRAAASLINTAVGLSGVGGVIGIGVGLFGRLDKLEGAGKAFRGMAADPQRITARLQSRPVKLALRVLTLVTPLRRIKRRSPGYALLGLRLIDGRNGRPPSRRQAFVRSTSKRLWLALWKKVLPVPKVSQRDHTRDNPMSHAFLPVLARFPLLAAIDLPIFSAPLKQSLPDRLAGTTVVRERQSSARD
jgi:hypothetical protein